MRSLPSLFLLLCAMSLLPVAPGWANPQLPAGLMVHDLLIHAPSASPGRTALHTDPIEHALVTGTWSTPQAGVDGWEVLAPRKDWAYEHEWLSGGWASWQIESPVSQVLLLEAKGHLAAYVNGEIRMGDVYSTGYVRLPVQLHAGTNEFLFLAGRGHLHPMLTVPDAPVMINERDLTLPHWNPQDRPEKILLGVPVINAQTRSLAPNQDYALVVTSSLFTVPLATVPLGMPALISRKLPVEFPTPPAEITTDFPLTLSIVRGDEVLFSHDLVLPIAQENEPYRVTFKSTIDDSVQYYAVRPQVGGDTGDPGAIVLSLHGASVEALGQAQAYGPQDWATIVCPTNRRPFGFDWEDWGRLDALEVLRHARQRFGMDAPLYLTGHSMGGHGTWYLAATASAPFRGVGPSAGWESFYTYGGKPRIETMDPIRERIERASNQSETPLLLSNLLQYPIYVLHGADDDNVPVEQARGMVEKLRAAGHSRLMVHEEPGVGHWWDHDPRPGADCVDWQPMWDFMRNQPSPETNSTDITVVNPALGPTGEIVIEQQIVPLMPSRVQGSWDAGRTSWTGTTSNVAGLSFETSSAEVLTQVAIDGSFLMLPPSTTHFLTRGTDGWRVTVPESDRIKWHRRSGPFKQAFNNRFVLVYSTGGTPEENAASFARARYDLEQWWVRGNGDAPLIADGAYIPDAWPEHSVILYGNAETNRAWDLLLGDAPIRVTRETLQLGDQRITGADIGGLFCWPRPDAAHALVGVVTGTGPQGLRLTERMRYFNAGVHFPDYCFLTPENLLDTETGIVAAGYFGNDWSLATGDPALSSD